MKRWMISFVCAVFLLSFALPASSEVLIGEVDDVKLWTEIHTVGTFQAFDEDFSDNNEADIGSSLQTAWGNIDWRIEREGIWEMFFDATMASRVKTDRWWGHQGYIRLNKLPEDSPISMLNGLLESVDVKAGHFSLDFGDQLRRRSINADVQRNPVVGNYLVTPEATEPGIEVIGDNTGRVKWLVGVGIGDSTENFKKDRGWSFHGKIWGNVKPNLRLAASYYTVDHSDIVGAHGGPGHLFGTDRSTGTRFGGLTGFDGLITPGNGYDVQAYQFDVDWDITPRTNFNAHWGYVEDADVNGDSTVAPGSGDNSTPAEEWNYYGADVTHYVMDNVYLAARYSVADADKIQTTGGQTNSPGEAEQLEAGVGAWLTKRVLLKATYVDAEAKDLGAYSGGIQSQEFNGVISEVSITL